MQMQLDPLAPFPSSSPFPARRDDDGTFAAGYNNTLSDEEEDDDGLVAVQLFTELSTYGIGIETLSSLPLEEKSTSVGERPSPPSPDDCCFREEYREYWRAEAEGEAEAEVGESSFRLSRCAIL